VRDRAITPSRDKSSAPIASSITRRGAAMAARPITDDLDYTLCRDQGNPLGYGRNQGTGVLEHSPSTSTLVNCAGGLDRPSLCAAVLAAPSSSANRCERGWNHATMSYGDRTASLERWTPSDRNAGKTPHRFPLVPPGEPRGGTVRIVESDDGGGFLIPASPIGGGRNTPVSFPSG
jgi:hypothetical protein